VFAQVQASPKPEKVENARQSLRQHHVDRLCVLQKRKKRILVPPPHYIMAITPLQPPGAIASGNLRLAVTTAVGFFVVWLLIGYAPFVEFLSTQAYH
jgi:hypothetical protein